MASVILLAARWEAVFHSQLVPPFLLFPCSYLLKSATPLFLYYLIWHLDPSVGGLGPNFQNVSSLNNQSRMTSVCLQLRSVPWHNPWPFLQGCAISTPLLFNFVLFYFCFWSYKKVSTFKSKSILKNQLRNECVSFPSFRRSLFVKWITWFERKHILLEANNVL